MGLRWRDEIHLHVPLLLPKKKKNSEDADEEELCAHMCRTQKRIFNGEEFADFKYSMCLEVQLINLFIQNNLIEEFRQQIDQRLG